MSSLTVVLAVRGPHEAAIATALDRHPGIVVSRRCADLTEALAVAHAGHGAVVVLSDHPQLDRAVLAEFAAAGTAIVGAPGTLEAQDRLRSLGVDEHVPPGADPVRIAASVLAGAERAAPLLPDESGPEQAVGSGAVIAVWGPTGAPGRTTVATNLAAELAAGGTETLCVDVDTHGGAVAQAFGLLDEAPGVAALARAALSGGLTPQHVRRHALEVAPQLRVLTGIARAERWPELPAAALDPMWDALRSEAAAIVVDCGFGLESDEALAYDTRAPQRHGATLSALAAADVVVAVGGAEPLSVQRLVHGLGALEVAKSGVSPLVVVNRVRSAVAGPSPERALADALARFADVDEIWPVPFDPKGCDAATLEGRMLRERSPRAPARRAIAGIARGIRVRLDSRVPRGVPEPQVTD